MREQFRTLRFGYVLLVLGLISVSLASATWMVFRDPPEQDGPIKPKSRVITSAVQEPPPGLDKLLIYAQEYINTTFTYPGEMRMACESFPDNYSICYLRGPARDRSIGTWKVICKTTFECETFDLR